jgi:hypothetical protein
MQKDLQVTPTRLEEIRTHALKHKDCQKILLEAVHEIDRLRNELRDTLHYIELTGVSMKSEARKRTLELLR